MTEKSIYLKLMAAQENFGRIVKNTKAYNYKYATLEAVLDAVKNALADEGLLLIQQTTKDSVKTLIVDGDGNEIDFGEVILRISKDDMQAVGSAITYARRYGIVCALGLAPEDDDGQAAIAKPQQNIPKQAEAPKRNLTAAQEELRALGLTLYNSGDDSLKKAVASAINKHELHTYTDEVCQKKYAFLKNSQLKGRK